MCILVSAKTTAFSANSLHYNYKKSHQDRQLAEILFGFCEDCRKMAAVPHGAFAACKLRTQKKSDLVVSKVPNSEKPECKNYANEKLSHYAPVKYNDKLMNSIWGLYNRYSPHNIKSNDDELAGRFAVLQQPLAVAAHTISKELGMGTKNGNVWTFPYGSNK